LFKVFDFNGVTREEIVVEVEEEEDDDDDDEDEDEDDDNEDDNEDEDDDNDDDNEKEKEVEEDIPLYQGLEETYTLGKTLGKGSYSIVREATQKISGEKFAVKILKLNNLDLNSSDSLKPLRREINIHLKLKHPNIINLFQVFIDQSETCFYLVMELLPNSQELFSKILDESPFSEVRTYRIFQQIVSGVEYLHEMGIAHRDLKPENILVCGENENEKIKLVDFGFAKNFQNEIMKTSLGSPLYAAPELFLKRNSSFNYDEKVDLWSMGVILFICLSGFPPFNGKNLKELIDNIIQVKFNFHDNIWSNVSDESKDIISHLLLFNPEKRYTAKELKYYINKINHISL